MTFESRAGFNRSRFSPPYGGPTRPPAPAAVRGPSRWGPASSSLVRRSSHEGGTFAMETGASNELDMDRAVLEAYTQLLGKLGRAPHLLVATCSSAFDGKAVVAQLQRLAPNAVIHGTTSFSGCISRDGRQRFGLLGFYDPDGHYAVGISGPGANKHATAREAGRSAARQALKLMGDSFAFEMPTCALVNVATGAEEEVLRGIEDIVRRDVLIVGGSCADESFDGSWWVCAATPAGVGSGGSAQAATSYVATDGVAITLMWPSVRVQLMMSSCFEPSAARGVATRVEGRTLWEVDGEGAAEWYARHGGQAFRDQLAAFKERPSGGACNVLSATTLGPLGRWAGAAMATSEAAASEAAASEAAADATADVTASDLTLVHPARIVPIDGSGGGQHGLECFADFGEGDTVVMMAAQQGLDTLTTHPSSVMSCMDAPERVRGCLVVYCAGCAIAIGDARIDEVVSSFSSALHHPFFGMFTYGEQCRTSVGANRHVNLMYGVLAFGD